MRPNAARAFATALPVHPVGGSAPIVGSIEDSDGGSCARGGQRTRHQPDRQELIAGRRPRLSRATRTSSARWPRATGAARTYRPVMMLACGRAESRAGHRAHPARRRAGRAHHARCIVETIRITAAALAGDFGIARPRIAVAGLNPHAGEGGMIGSEEEDVIAPAIAELRGGRHRRDAARYPADTLFHAEARASYDAAVAMYHDQALIPLKTLAFDARRQRHARPAVRAHLARSRHRLRARRHRQGARRTASSPRCGSPCDIASRRGTHTP